MKLPGFLNKPRWQSKEAAVRRAGVAGDDDAELLASLARFAREDADAGVRIAALKRLADPALAQRLARDDADAGVRAEARKLWFDLIAGTHPRSPSPGECARLIRAQDEAALIEHVARSGVDADVRAAALALVTRSSLLAERATADPVPALRLAALERIDDESLLERLAERTRKTDKLVSRRARERADALRIARGDTDTVTARARLLCERMEKLVRLPAGDEAAADIETQWASIEAQAGDQYRARYQAARTLLLAARNPSSRSDAVVDEIAPAANEAEPELPIVDEMEAKPPAEPSEAPAEPAPAPVVEPLLAQARFAVSLNKANATKEQDQQQRQAAMQRIETAVAEFENAVAEGIAARAHAAHADLAALRKENRGALPNALMRRLNEAERRYAELSQWQHWSDNQRRKQLCESIEELAGSGLHPDAVATRVREAQAEWSRLDAAEGHAAAGSATHGWARRFHSACRHALEPAKSYFRKRQELRKTYGQAIAASLEQAAAIPEDSTDWPLIAKSRHAIVECLRTLDRVDPHERKVFARNLKSALVALDARLAKHHAEIESAKSALIAEARALAEADAQRSAAAAARTLQQRWRDVGNGRRDRDQAQWKTFRAALDAVFGKLDAERSQRSAREVEARSRAEALCGDMENLARAVTPPARAAVTAIESEWDSLNVREDSVLRRFRAAQAGLRDAAARRERAARRTPYDAWLARYRLCRSAERAIEPAEELRVKWDVAAQSEIAPSELAARFAAAMGGGAPASDPDGDEEYIEARELLVRLEIFAGLESPPEDHEIRRRLQVERLSARMRGAAAGSTPERELTELLTRWIELAPVNVPALDARLERDLAAAVETLP